MFGIQIAQTGRIYDMTVANELKKEVCSQTSEDWSFYQKTYKPLFNKYQTQFKSLAPKNRQFEIVYRDISNDIEVMKKQREAFENSANRSSTNTIVRT